MRISTLVVLLPLGIGLCSAQPTLTQATNSFIIGRSVNLAYSAYRAPGAAGAGVTWDFSDLLADSTDFVEWVDPAATASGPLFPQATIAELWEVVQYGVQDGTGLYVIGTDEEGTIVSLSDTRRALAWPFTYGDSWSDPYAGTYTASGFNVTRTGTYGGEADAYGTLLMPWGTVNNALRVHKTADQSDVSLFGSVTQNIDAYVWFVAGEPWPVVEVVNNTVNTPIGTVTITYTLWLSDAVTSVMEPDAAVPALHGHMLPGGMAFQFDRPVSGVVLNTAGQEVATLDRDPVIGLEEFTPGVYMLRSNTGEVLRFVRE